MPEGTGQAQTDPAQGGAVVVMGVAGCGKTVVGEGLARVLGWRFIEGDQLHPQANIERMSAGMPLTDAHRWSWLDAIGMQIAEAGRDGAGSVAACSALKRAYRDRLRSHDSRLLFIYLDIDKATAAARVAARKGHFMPASLVDSQFADLQPPGPDEAALRLDARRAVGDLISDAAAVFRAG